MGIRLKISSGMRDADAFGGALKVRQAAVTPR